MTAPTVCIDWAAGRVVGHHVSEDPAGGPSVVRLLLDGRCVDTDIARRPASEPSMLQALAGLPMPAREGSAFELRIAAGAWTGGAPGPEGVALEVVTARGERLWGVRLHRTDELLRLLEQAPLEQLFEVRFLGVEAGRLSGEVVDRHDSGRRPALCWRLNDGAPQPLEWLDPLAGGPVHAFAVPLSSQDWRDGPNRLSVVGPQGAPLATYPIELGAAPAGELDRRVAALEAELAFLKHLALRPHTESVDERLAAFKGDMVNLCADMLALQRQQLEREIRAMPGPSGD